jgi:hypothetical protein
MPAQQTPTRELANPQFIEEGEKKHLSELATHLSQATNSQVKLQDIQPVLNQHPLPQFAPPAASSDQILSGPQGEGENGQVQYKETPDSDLEDFMEGMRGRPRSAPAIDFLKGKLNLLKKKYGSNVQLVKK